MSALKRTEREISNVLKKMDLSHNVEVALKDMKGKGNILRVATPFFKGQGYVREF